MFTEADDYTEQFIEFTKNDQHVLEKSAKEIDKFKSLANYKSKEFVGLSKTRENVVLREYVRVGGKTIIWLRKEKDQLIEENKQIKKMVGDKLDQRIAKERATKAIKIKNENDNIFLLEKLQKTMRMSKSLTK
jgi:hypothetical protein